ncbi:hypothetical protein Tco_1454674 [Tanacetum coccineum]
MAPTTRAIGGSNVNGETVDDSTRRYVDEALAGIRRGDGSLGVNSFFLIDPIVEDRLLSMHLFDKALLWHM